MAAGQKRRGVFCHQKVGRSLPSTRNTVLYVPSTTLHTTILYDGRHYHWHVCSVTRKLGGRFITFTSFHIRFLPLSCHSAIYSPMIVVISRKTLSPESWYVASQYSPTNKEPNSNPDIAQAASHSPLNLNRNNLSFLCCDAGGATLKCSVNLSRSIFFRVISQIAPFQGPPWQTLLLHGSVSRLLSPRQSDLVSPYSQCSRCQLVKQSSG